MDVPLERAGIGRIRSRVPPAERKGRIGRAKLTQRRRALPRANGRDPPRRPARRADMAPRPIRQERGGDIDSRPGKGGDERARA